MSRSGDLVSGYRLILGHVVDVKIMCKVCPSSREMQPYELTYQRKDLPK